MFKFLKQLIEWTEVEITRGRKIVLFSTVFVYLIVTIAIVILAFVDPLRITEETVHVFAIFTGLMVTVYGFYTGTSSAKDNFIRDFFKSKQKYDSGYPNYPGHSGYPNYPDYPSYPNYQDTYNPHNTHNINKNKERYDDEYEIPKP